MVPDQIILAKPIDSLLEGDGFEPLVPRHKSRGFAQHYGHCGVSEMFPQTRRCSFPRATGPLCMHIAAPLRRVRTPDFLLKLGRSLSAGFYAAIFIW